MLFSADGRRFLVPQVIQSSAMDCGPAALKSMLEGYGIHIDYGRLREACQTDVDGTSIDTIEELARQLGMDAAQLLVPADHVLLPEADALPALMVTVEPGGGAHFIVIWRTLGAWAQIMDPATGRHWVRLRTLQQRFYRHRHPVSASDWLAWASSEPFLTALRARMRKICDDEDWADACITQALQSGHWSGIATLDAATRMVTSLVDSGGLQGGSEAGEMIHQLTRSPDIIPAHYWLLYPDEHDSEQLIFHCAVIIHVSGRKQTEDMEAAGEKDDAPPPHPELEAARHAEKPKVARHVLSVLHRDGWLTPTLVIICLILSAAGMAIEVAVFRGLIEIGQQMHLLPQRLEAFTLVALFLLSLLILEWPLTLAGLAIGRKLEIRLRQRFLEKMPRLEDRYFHSRLTADMIQRAHELRDLRNLPDLAFQLLRQLTQIILVTIGLIILYPGGFWLILISVYLLLWLAFISQPLLQEQDMQLRTHTGSLSRFYLDALLGITPIQAHRAAPSLQAEHDRMLVHWMRSGRSFYNAYELSSLVQLLVSTTLAIVLVFAYLSSPTRDSSGTLLLLYWMLQLPLLGSALADLAHQYPAQRNRLLRILEPLTAPEESLSWYEDGLARPSHVPTPESSANSSGVAVHFHRVSLNLAGRTVLRRLDLHLRGGEHVAIVGRSGSGKSSLIGLLLGWYRPQYGGSVWVDGKLLHGDDLQQLRRETVWVDPEVQLWRHSLAHNVRYGEAHHPKQEEIAPDVWSQADLLQLLDQLPEGEHTCLGEGGRMLSGGEAQRVRLARGFNRKRVRLVILDEPFRGLTRDQRRTLLQRARAHWQHATLLFISHDVEDSLTFDRVWVMAEGRVVEDAVPGILVADDSSHYRHLLESERNLREMIWESANWRKIRIEAGELVEQQDG